jgi:hypothetical protein
LPNICLLTVQRKSDFGNGSIASSHPPRTAAIDLKADSQTGNGSNPMCIPAQLGWTPTGWLVVFSHVLGLEIIAVSTW